LHTRQRALRVTVEPSPKTVFVSTTFEMDFWLRDIHLPINGWSIYVVVPIDLIEVIYFKDLYPTISFPATDDVRIRTVKFHCLGAGTVTVDVLEDVSYVVIDGAEYDVVGVDGVIHQTIPQPVGGVTSPINKLEILTPYLALAGLIAAVSAVVVVKRRSKA